MQSIFSAAMRQIRMSGERIFVAAAVS